MAVLTRKIRKDGASAITTIPQEILKTLGLSIGDNLTFEKMGEGVLIKNAEGGLFDKGDVSDDFMSIVNETIADHKDMLTKMAEV